MKNTNSAIISLNKSLFSLIIILSFCFLLQSCVKQDTNINIIPATSYLELSKHYVDSLDNDIIYVDDIDFTPTSKDEYITNMKMTVSKSITIKSFNKENNATFKNGMFLLKGNKSFGDDINVRFENINFDGNIDSSNLSYFELLEEGFYGHAVEFYGNVNCEFINCNFSNYYHDNGAIIEARYDDYTMVESLSSLFPDLSNCKLNLTFDNCNLSNNTSLYSGGALYIEGNNNIVLNIKNSTFSNNHSSALYSFGGGAIYAKGTKLSINNCKFINNVGNCVYDEATYFVDNYGFNYLQDNSLGGAFYVSNGQINMVNSVIDHNVCTRGGGVALTNSIGLFDGCIFSNNVATRCNLFVEDDSINLPCSVGMGGALYSEGFKTNNVTFINSSIVDNVADIAYAGIFNYYDGLGLSSTGNTYVSLILSTYMNNNVRRSYSYDQTSILWNNVPGDIFYDPSLIVKGSLIVDESFEENFPKLVLPSSESNYSSFIPLSKQMEYLTISYDDYIPVLSYNEVDSWIIPNGEINSDYYKTYKTDKFLVGSNFNKDLYCSTVMPENNILTILLISSISLFVCLILLLLLIRFIIKRKKLKNIDNQVSDSDNNVVKKYVYVNYTKEQIEQSIQNVKIKSPLTNREKEVLTELLLGNKQIDIAKKLYISVSTVKDFYKKIYIKFEVESKEELVKKILGI